MSSTLPCCARASRRCCGSGILGLLSIAAAPPPRDQNVLSIFLNLRVTDISRYYDLWSSRGAHFITEPKVHATELRCYMRDPDGYLIEVGQTTMTTVRWIRTHRAMQDLVPSGLVHLFHRMCTGRHSRSQPSLTVIRCGVASRAF